MFLAQAAGIPFGRHSGGRLAMTLKATIILYFLLLFFPLFPRFFLCCLLFSKKECLDLNTYLAKVDEVAQKPRGRNVYRLCQPFWCPCQKFWILQVERRCRWWASAPGATKLVFLYIFTKPSHMNNCQSCKILWQLWHTFGRGCNHSELSGCFCPMQWLDTFGPLSCSLSLA